MSEKNRTPEQAANVMRWAARNAQRLGLDGTLRLRGVTARPDEPPREVELAPTEWLARLDGSHTNLDGVQWVLPDLWLRTPHGEEIAKPCAIFHAYRSIYDSPDPGYAGAGRSGDEVAEMPVTAKCYDRLASTIESELNRLAELLALLRDNGLLSDFITVHSGEITEKLEEAGSWNPVTFDAQIHIELYLSFDRPIGEHEHAQADKCLELLISALGDVDDTGEVGRWSSGVEAAQDEFRAPQWFKPQERQPIEFSRFIKAGNVMSRAGGDVRAFENLCRRARLIEPTAGRWLVRGLLPAGVLAVLAGPEKTGKSTALHELAVTLAADAPSNDAPASWLGFDIESDAHGEVYFLSFEENEDDFFARESALDPEGIAAARLTALWGLQICDLEPKLRQIEARARAGNAPRLLIIDSLRGSMGGSENNDGDVKPYMDRLYYLSGRTGCTVMVIHHAHKMGRKGTERGTAPGAYRARFSGSTVIVSRPRVLLFMEPDARERGVVSFGPVGLNRDPLQIEGVMRRYRHDGETRRHLPIDEPAPANRGPAASRQAGRPARATPDPDRDAAAVLEALADCRANGRKVTKTGQASLFNMARPGLAHMTRKRLEEVIQSLIESNRVTSGPEGLRIVETGAPMSDKAA